MAEKPNPIHLAMIICDTVIEDKQTAKKTLVGLFNNINASSVPTVHPSFNIYIALTEGNGSYGSTLKCLKGDKPIMEIQGPIVFNNPHQIVELNYTLRNIPFPEYGEYRFEFLCNEILVISRKFRVSPIPKQKKGGENDHRDNK